MSGQSATIERRSFRRIAGFAMLFIGLASALYCAWGIYLFWTITEMMLFLRPAYQPLYQSLLELIALVVVSVAVAGFGYVCIRHCRPGHH